MIRVFIGYDKREAIAAQVLAYSIQKRSSLPVSITFLKTEQLDCYWRERDPKQSTDFTYTRFLVPYLCNYEGQAIFMDCDMLCLTDIAELLEDHEPLRDTTPSISVVKHDYIPKDLKKFLNQEQTAYKRKNWSSLMVFSNSQCKVLTKAVVNQASGMFLHQFHWLEDDQIERIPQEFNYLVGEYKPTNAKIIHFTNGGPWFKEYENCEYADEWRKEYEEMICVNG